MVLFRRKSGKKKLNTLTTILLTSIITLFFVILLGFIPGIDYFRYYVSGYSINRSAFGSPVRSVLWEQPVILSGQMNEVHGNNDAAISPDGKTIILARSYSPYNKDLYISYLKDDKWSKPRSLKSLNTQYNEITPEISDNGKILLFSSDRPGGIGGYDIWCSEKVGEEWSEPFLLEININSKYNEKNPYLTEDMESFYLSSDRPGTAGGYSKDVNDTKNNDFDIFLSTITPDNKLLSRSNHEKYFSLFKDLERLDVLNSPYDEGKVAVTEKGNMIYFSSNRPGGIGGYDLYKSYRIEGKYVDPYNFGEPVNTEDDEVSPSLSLEGFGLFFCSNIGSRNPSNFYIYHTSSREVLTKYDYSLLFNILLIIIFTLLSVFVLWIILRLLIYKADMKMIVKCLLIALLLHLLFVYLSAFWFFTEKLAAKKQRIPEEMTININALARESVATAIREGTASLPRVKSASTTEKPLEKISIPAQKPAVQSDASISWQASFVKPSDSPVTMSKSKSESEVETKTVTDNSITDIRPVLLGSADVTLESSESIGENEAAPKHGQAKGLPSSADTPKFKQEKKIFKKLEFSPDNRIETKDIEVALIKEPIGKTELKTVLVEEPAEGGIDSISNIADSTEFAKSTGMNSIDTGWPGEAGSLFIQNDFQMVTPNTEKDSQPELGMITTDNQILGHESFALRQQSRDIIVKERIFDSLLIYNLYRFLNFRYKQQPFETTFSERVDNILYSATPKFIIITDSELEVPEKYFNQDKI